MAIVLFQGRLMGYNRDAAKSPHTRSIANRCYYSGEPGHNSSVRLAYKPCTSCRLG